MRIGLVVTAIAFITAIFFGLMAAAYGFDGWAERCAAAPSTVHGVCGWFHWATFPGISQIANILFLVLIPVMITATVLTVAERKWSALTQNRIGPNRARLAIVPGLKDRALGGLPHIVADVLKMMTKEAFMPRAANGFLFKLAPMLAFAPVVVLFAIVPAGPTLPIFGRQVMMSVSNPDFGLLYVLAIASLGVYGTSLAGWSSNNKFGLLGGVRASSQMISYEVALGLSLVGMMIAFSTVQLAGETGMSAMQGRYLWALHLGTFDLGIPSWGILLQPVGFVLFFAAAFAETKRAPFDVPEGDSEIVGYFIEYSGMQFGLFMISEFVEVVVLAGIITAIFLGGWWLPFGNEWLSAKLSGHAWLLGTIYGTVFWLKVVFLCWVQLMIRWTFPRFRYDQIQTLGWKILLPLGLANVFVSGALILWDPSLRLLAIGGFVELAVIVFLTLTAPRQTREKQAAAEHGGHGHGHDLPVAAHADHPAPAIPH